MGTSRISARGGVHDVISQEGSGPGAVAEVGRSGAVDIVEVGQVTGRSRHTVVVTCSSEKFGLGSRSF